MPSNLRGGQYIHSKVSVQGECSTSRSLPIYESNSTARNISATACCVCSHQKKISKQTSKQTTSNSTSCLPNPSREPRSWIGDRESTGESGQRKQCWREDCNGKEWNEQKAEGKRPSYSTFPCTNPSSRQHQWAGIPFSFHLSYPVLFNTRVESGDSCRGKGKVRE